MNDSAVWQVPTMKLAEIFDPEVEKQIRQEIIEHYTGAHPDPAKYADMLMDFLGYEERFQFLFTSIENFAVTSNNKFLCSGFSVGSEMMVARQYNFGEIHGVEVDEFLVRICQKRVQPLQDMFPVYYQGRKLLYEDNSFGVIVSGHVIEHVGDPQVYINECMRVLDFEGVLSLEFPNRYHWKELHTGLFSFEWAPRFLRDAMYVILASKLSPLKNDVKSRYRSIVDTKLQQISLAGLRHMLWRSGYGYQIHNPSTPTQGIIRVVVQKKHKSTQPGGKKPRN